ncbi:MAG TPA: hybrid sensor histidine kinase/response regulator [Polyangiaceae bacterium]|nr:hybrid sensor histidine kinase/response regulator [Polyangiaceae bacterium]
MVDVHSPELGELKAACEPIAYHAAFGHIVLASKRPGFPSASELAIIRAATSLVTTSLDAARALQQREAALRAKDDFLAMLGHELRNPLAPIVSALGLIEIRKGRLEPEEEIIARHVRHLGRLVDDLLDVARVSRGSLELKLDRVDLETVVADAVEATQPLFDARRHTLRLEVSSGLTVHGDASRLTQVFSNLLANAAKYTDEGGAIVLRSVSTGDGFALVSVLDSGQGIARGLLPFIFQPFVQGHRRSDEQYGGLGVGLALVKTLVELHGGQVTAESEGPGSGSRFDVRLPLMHAKLTNQRSADAAPDAPVASAPLRRRILVVDDNTDAASLLGETLQLFGHEVRVIDDSRIAMEAVADFVPDVAILDLGMPVMDGFELAKTMRARFASRAPVLIALTGYGRERDRERARAAGFDAHFVKPVDVRRLAEYIASVSTPR